MTIKPRRIILLTLATLIPASALAAAAGSGGGLCSSVCGLMGFGGC